jgi:hypothetical protein
VQPIVIKRGGMRRASCEHKVLPGSCFQGEEFDYLVITRESPGA